MVELFSLCVSLDQFALLSCTSKETALSVVASTLFCNQFMRCLFKGSLVSTEENMVSVTEAVFCKAMGKNK